MYRHTRSVADKVFDIWRSPDRFTKNPDIIRLNSGRMLLCYCDNDAHWSQEVQILTVLASDDDGKSWTKLTEVDRADKRKDEERLVTPRISYLPDGRLVIIIDHDDYSHFHENQPPGITLYWSNDEGKTWMSDRDNGIMGFEPDRIMVLPDGRLSVLSHMMLRESQEFCEVQHCSEDGGKTWYRQAIVAHDGYHRFCEGAMVILDDGDEIACVMRENHSAGIPCFVAFSRDNGRNWSAPQMMPFAIHRPYAKQLSDGRVLVTGRHVNGGLGCYAWVGDLRKEAGTYAVGGPRTQFAASLHDGELVIENKPGHECRYSLLPPESPRSEVLFEAEVKVEGTDGEYVAFMSLSQINSLVLAFAPDAICMDRNHVGSETKRPVDMRKYHRISIRHKKGLLQILVDGEVVMNKNVFWESRSIQDFRGGVPANRCQFGQLFESGKSYWRSVRYDVKNPTLVDFNWGWNAESGRWPDEYQRTRMIQIHGNDPKEHHSPDHGYSSWLKLPDGRIFLADYTNLGDKPGKSHLVGVYLDAEDLK